MARSVPFAVLASFLVGGCVSGLSSGGAGCGGGPQDGVPFDLGEANEDPGPELVRLEPGTSFAFTPDEREIVYSAYMGTRHDAGPWPEPYYVLRSVRLSDGTTRDLSDLPMRSREAFALTPDGAALYYLAYDGASSTGMVLREAFSRSNLTLAGRAPLAFAVSTGSSQLLVDTVPSPEWGAADTVLVDRATGQFAPTPCAATGGAAFSPAGDELVCGRRVEGDVSSWQLVRYRAADGVTLPLPGLSRCGWDAVTRWTSEGLVLGCQLEDGALVFGDPETGAELASSDAGAHAERGVFSPDGAAFAFAAASRCLAGWMTEEGDRIQGCSRWEWQVQIVDVGTGARRVLATSGADVGTIAFSADGKTLAYLLGGTVHARATGR